MRSTYHRASCDVARVKWEAGELPQSLQLRLPALHAHSFIRSLAQAGRALSALSDLDLGPASAEVSQAYGDLDAAIPSLKDVRDSIEHAEDRMRGQSRGCKLSLAPIVQGPIHAPDGGVLVGDLLVDGRTLGWTTADGSLQHVEISDATIESARAAVQRALDALPWKKSSLRYEPSA
jgi:hypothetical protein